MIGSAISSGEGQQKKIYDEVVVAMEAGMAEI
jgi:hypothetical protein